MSGKSFYSNGKLLLTGEYLVLNGAKALAVPLKFGQSLTFTPFDSGLLEWKTYVNRKLWLSLETNVKSQFDALKTSDFKKTDYLLKVLRAANNINPLFPEMLGPGLIEAEINFDINWGLGSSSTLITNIARLAGIDPFALHDKVSKGSGYDIAAAQSNQPIIFRIESGKRKFENVGKQIPFQEHISFVYLGRKQSSDISVSNYLTDSRFSESTIEEISLLTEKFITCTSLLEMAAIIKSHEEIISSVIGIQPLQKGRFTDFKGIVKSLGAWGGDFIMAVSPEDKGYVKKYFNSKNLNIIFGYDEIAI